MEWAALIAWIVTAGGGSLLLAIWLRQGGMQQREGGDRIRPPLPLAHFGLAATGLVLWLIYVLTDTGALAWIAFALLVLVAALGWAMFFVWWRRRRARALSAATEAVPAEQHFPVPLVALHGVGAVVTVLLVLLAAAGVG
jgi:manganese efflux pump family protein